MPRRRNPIRRPWKLSYLERNLKLTTRTFASEITANREAEWLRTNGYQGVEVQHVPGLPPER